ALQYSIQHARIGFADDNVWKSACSVLYTGIDGTTVHQDNLLVGRAHSVRIGRNIGELLGYPPRCTAQSGIAQRHIKSHHDGVGDIRGVVRSRNKSFGFKFANHTWCSEDEEPFDMWQIVLYILNCCLSGG